MNRPSPRAWRGVAVVPAIALALLLTGCGSNDPGIAIPGTSTAAASVATTSTSAAETSASEESSDQSSTSEEVSTSEEGTTSEEASTSDQATTSDQASTSDDESTSSESSSPASKPIVGRAQPITKPGVTLKIDAAAVLEYQTGKKSDSYYQHGTFSTTIVKIVKGDPKIFDQIKNKADFKDYVPYFIYSQDVILTHEGKTDGNPPTSSVLYSILKDGSLAGKAIGLATLKGCDSEFFDDASVGAMSKKCTVALAEKGGDPVVGVAFTGNDDVYPSPDDNPYNKKPVVWMP